MTVMDLEEYELLSLYFYLSDKKELPEQVDSLLNKLEKKIFESFTVKKIEIFRETYNDKGRI